MGVFAGFPGFHPGLVELALQAGIARKGPQPGEALYWQTGLVRLPLSVDGSLAAG